MSSVLHLLPGTGDDADAGHIFLLDPASSDATAVIAYFDDRGFTTTLDDCPDLEDYRTSIGYTVTYTHALPPNIITEGNEILASRDAVAAAITAEAPSWLRQAADAPCRTRIRSTGPHDPEETTFELLPGRSSTSSERAAREEQRAYQSLLAGNRLSGGDHPILDHAPPFSLELPKT